MEGCSPFAAVIHAHAAAAQLVPFPYFPTRRTCALLTLFIFFFPIDSTCTVWQTATTITAGGGTSGFGVALTADAADLHLPLRLSKPPITLGLTTPRAKLRHVQFFKYLICLVLFSCISQILVKNKYAEIQLEVAPDIRVPNTRSMHFIWVHYMQY